MEFSVAFLKVFQAFHIVNKQRCVVYKSTNLFLGGTNNEKD
jgi:hypothetical protein